ncbi:MAG: type I 3-dehydroquinate dehydratase [Candidatus Bathyarchaeia archaeon]
MNAKICVSILPKNIDNALTLITKAEESGADFVEVRMDYLEETRNLSELSKKTKLPLIATNKLQTEKGFFTGSEIEKQQTLLNAAKAGFTFIDIDYFSPKCKETIDIIKQLGAKTIVSYHKFDSIQTVFSLETILGKQISLGADVCKIVLTAQQIEDNLPILNFVSFASTKAKLVCFCMGEEGKISRLLSPIFGAFFTFASLEESNQTAIGQMNIKDMKTAYKVLGIEQ